MSWQDYVAMTLVAAAAVVVAMRAYRAMFGRAKAGCGSGCGSCGNQPVSMSKPDSLISIGAPPEVRRMDSR